MNPRTLHIASINVDSPDSSGLVDAQSANFPGSEEDFNTLFDLTSSLARLAANEACNERSLSHTAAEQTKKKSQGIHLARTINRIQNIFPLQNKCVIITRIRYLESIKGL